MSKAITRARASSGGVTVAMLLTLVVPNSASAQTAVATPAPVPVAVVQPQRGSVNRWVTLPGNVRAQQEVTLYAKVAGYLKSISVDRGDSVKAGATLAILETPELTADLARYRAESEAARVEYERMQQAIQKAPDLVMPVELDRAKGKHDVARANVERTQSLLGFGRITAPFSGVITRRFADVGAFIPAGTAGSAAQSAAIVTLMHFSTVRVHVAVPEVEAALVTKGQPARVSVEGLPERKFEGRVSRMSYALDETTKTMAVEVELPNPTLALRPGIYASVQLALQQHDDAMLIPVAALVMEKTNAFTNVAEGAKARKRP